MFLSNAFRQYLVLLTEQGIFSKKKTERPSFESSLSPCNTLQNEYQHVLIKTNLQETFEIKLYNKEGKTLFIKYTALNRETKAIAIPTRDIEHGYYSISVSNQREHAVMPFEK